MASRSFSRAGAPRNAKNEYFSGLPARPDHRCAPSVRLNVAVSLVPSMSWKATLLLKEISRSIQSATKSACLRMISGLLASASFAPVPHAGMRRTGELQVSNVLPLAGERFAHEQEP